MDDGVEAGGGGGDEAGMVSVMRLRAERAIARR